jgi:hypothetical protein
MVNHKKDATNQGKSLLKSGTSSFVPQENVGIKDKGINTPPSTVHSRWMTLNRFRREKKRYLEVSSMQSFSSDKRDPPDSPPQADSTA